MLFAQFSRQKQWVWSSLNSLPPWEMDMFKQINLGL